ncbi:MFS family permease [Halanaeroarchaeum sp. HSR-CO]|uniref:MFS transporter n=1 Tax=Halanaeroarchaeum sp. HSR-CO TaxID=2866382 RepID=UPI00217E4E05|nr:MFS transporter [Halanaeroarchaeum sp. HSR-CO]UWG46363.1 MFS family permease [Halanaeroarchaeum sp. HSR-CO]
MDDNDRSIIGFLMVGHGMVHTYELSIPILLTAWLQEFSTSVAILGGAATVGYGLFGVGALPGGILVDRYGSKRLVIAGIAGMGASFVLLSVAPGVVAITAALALWGAAASVYHPAGLTLISNGVQDRGRGFAYHGMGGNVGIAAGPLVTALVLLAFDWRIVTVLLAVPALVATLYGLTVSFDPTAAVEFDTEADRSPPPTLETFTSETRRLFTLGFLVVFVIVSLNGLYYRGILTFLPDLLGDFLTTSVGDVSPGIFGPDSQFAGEFDMSRYLYAGLLTVGIAGQYLGGRLSDALEPDRGLVFVLVGLTVLALAFVPVAGMGLGGLLVASFVLGLILFAVQPLNQATIAKYSMPEARGLSFGYTYLAIFGIGALGASIVGLVLTYATVDVMFVVLALFSFASTVLALFLVSR